jgi:DNA-binding beta-propeller fold protein YncE
VALVPVYEPDKAREPTDLEFNPAKPDELWAINRRDGSVVIIERPGAPDASSQRLRDPAASHFMHRPPALAFGAMSEDWGMTWATCGDSDNGGNDFMGPALFSADLSIFAVPTPDGLGSHLDMLHSTTFCRGIAHVEGNVYWVVNGARGSLDLYDFARDHGPGKDDHADGKIYRYVDGMLAPVEGIPSHIEMSPDGRCLYIADTGTGRVLRLDTESGTLGESFGGAEAIEERRMVNGAILEEVVAPGTLEQPSGLAIHEGLIYVTDHATSRFYAFDMDGGLVRTLDTGLPAGSLAGLTFGPDGKVYFSDLYAGKLYRIDPIIE